MRNINSSSFPVTVIHSAPVWLPQTQTWMYNQVKYLPTDIESHIVCDSLENLDQFYLPNIHVVRKQSLLDLFARSGLKGARSLARLFWLWGMCHKTKPHIVHSHFGVTGWFDSLVVRLTKAKHVVTFYGVDVNMIPTQNSKWIKRYQALFNSADIFLCEGEHMAGCLKKLGCPSNKIQVQHLGVEVDKISFKPRRWQPGETLRVLIASTFNEKKGIPYALEALGQLQEEILLEITICGDAVPDERSQKEKRRILGVIEKYKMQPIIKMLGFQPYSVLMNLAYKHHIFISPSVSAADGDTEGGAPVTIIEMAASGMPIVSTRHCDIPGVIVDGVTGLLAPERDVNLLVRHIRWFLEKPNAWGHMLKAGRQKMEKEFDVQVQAKRLAVVYKNILT